MKESKELKEQIIKAGKQAVEQLIKVAKEDIIKYDKDDEFRDKELISIEELGLILEQHVNNYFNQDFTEALRGEFEQGLDIFPDNSSCATDSVGVFNSSLARNSTIIILFRSVRSRAASLVKYPPPAS